MPRKIAHGGSPFPGRRLALAVLLVAAAVGLCGGCSRRSAEKGPSAAASDTLSNGMPADLAPRLAPWAAMWQAAIPGFAVDSLTPTGRARAFGQGHVQPARNVDPADSEEAATFAVLGAFSPDGRYRLVFDCYQVISEHGGEIVIGGEPDSAPLLLDLRRGLSNRFEFCGTPCGYHWGCWIDSTRFVLAGWTERDARGDTLHGFLGVYSLADSSEVRYATRPVPRETFEKYRLAWHHWVRDCYLAWKAARPA